MNIKIRWFKLKSNAGLRVSLFQLWLKECESNVDINTKVELLHLCSQGNCVQMGLQIFNGNQKFNLTESNQRSYSSLCIILAEDNLILLSLLPQTFNFSSCTYCQDSFLSLLGPGNELPFFGKVMYFAMGCGVGKKPAT